MHANRWVNLKRLPVSFVAWMLRLTIAVTVAVLSTQGFAQMAGDFAYVANTGVDCGQCTANSVSKIDTGNNVVTDTIGVGSIPYGVAITPDRTRVYVANAGSNSVSVIETSTNTVIATIPVGTAPIGVAITPDGTRAVVANQGLPGVDVGTVSVIDTVNNTVIATVEVGYAPQWLAITPDGTRAYVPNAHSSTVSVISIADNTVIATIPVTNLAFGRPGAISAGITPNGARVYVTDFTEGAVLVIDTASNTVIATIGVGGLPYALAITPDGSRAYVVNEGSTSISVIDTGSNAVIATVEIGSITYGVAITRDGNRAYVTGASSEVAVIGTNPSDLTAYNTVVARVGVPFGPTGIATAGLPYSANIQPPINADGSSAFKAARGVIPVKFTLSLREASTCELPTATLSLSRVSNNTAQPIAESVYESPSDVGSTFRVSDCQYVYNLSAGSLGVGTYVAQIKISGIAVGSATFGLK